MSNSLSTLEQLCFSTTRIVTEDSAGGIYTGTGFFFSFQIEGKTIPLVVTNKHVVKGMVKGVFKMTEADASGNPIYDKHLSVEITNSFEQQWIMHPEDSVDLCAMPIAQIHNVAQQGGVSLFYRTFDSTLIPTSEVLEQIDVVEDIFMIGYPNGLWDNINNMPIVRTGTTATNYILDYVGKKEFLIDAACYPGSSGSPVFIYNNSGYKNKSGSLIIGGTRLLFLGILYAGPQQTTTGEIRIVDIPTAQTPISVASIPMNLGIVIKSEKLFDFASILESRMKKDMK